MKYNVEIMFSNYMGCVYETNIIASFESINWARDFVDKCCFVNDDEGVNFRIVENKA